MNKPLSAQELLEAQQKKEKTAEIKETAKEISNTQKSKEEAEVAENLNKKSEHEIKTKLREQGYESIEQGKADIETQIKVGLIQMEGDYLARLLGST